VVVAVVVAVVEDAAAVAEGVGVEAVPARAFRPMLTDRPGASACA
jgi:hypothetical protein